MSQWPSIKDLASDVNSGRVSASEQVEKALKTLKSKVIKTKQNQILFENGANSI